MKNLTIRIAIISLLTLALAGCTSIHKNTARQIAKQSCMLAKLAPIPEKDKIEKACNIGERVDELYEMYKGGR